MYRLEKRLILSLIFTLMILNIKKVIPECGIYCLHFLTEMLKGKNFHEYIKSLDDKTIEKYRNIFFRK